MKNKVKSSITVYRDAAMVENKMKMRVLDYLDDKEKINAFSQINLPIKTLNDAKMDKKQGEF